MPTFSASQWDPFYLMTDNVAENDIKMIHRLILLNGVFAILSQQKYSLSAYLLTLKERQ